MAKINGDWFHSRTSSHLSELAAIQLLVKSSLKTEFIGKRWTADRNNPRNDWIYTFSSTAKLGDESIQPSTMQTKIRNWIRLGFLKDSSILPLKWTQLGMLWTNAVKNGRGGDANLLYRLIIANAIALVSFSDQTRRGADTIPNKDGLAVKYLILEAKNHNDKISRIKLERLIDGDTTRVGKNYSYWRTDLIQSGLFKNGENSGLKISSVFSSMINAIENYEPTEDLTAQSIKNNPIAMGAPFQEALLDEFKEYASTELLEAIQTLSESVILLSEEQHSKRELSDKQLVRDPSWPNKVKQAYKYKCAVPECDSEGTLFIEAAHIMPFRIEDVTYLNAHRSDIENGISLCLSCHKMFDAGLFTLNADGTVKISKFIYSSELIQTEDQTNVSRVLISNNKKILLPDTINFNSSYAYYHKENIFLGE